MKFFPDTCGCFARSAARGQLWHAEGRDRNSGHGQKSNSPVFPWVVDVEGAHPLHACIVQMSSAACTVCVRPGLCSVSQDLFFLCVCERLRVSTLLSGMETLLYSSTSARGRHCNGQKAKQTIMSVV